MGGEGVRDGITALYSRQWNPWCVTGGTTPFRGAEGRGSSDAKAVPVTGATDARACIKAIDLGGAGLLQADTAAARPKDPLTGRPAIPDTCTFVPFGQGVS